MLVAQGFDLTKSQQSVFAGFFYDGYEAWVLDGEVQFERTHFIFPELLDRKRMDRYIFPICKQESRTETDAYVHFLTGSSQQAPCMHATSSRTPTLMSIQSLSFTSRSLFSPQGERKRKRSSALSTKHLHLHIQPHPHPRPPLSSPHPPSQNAFSKSSSSR